MATNPYIDQAKADTGIDPSKAWADLTWDEQQRYQQRLAELTAAHASELPAQFGQTAQAILAKGPQPAPEPYSIGEAIGDFGSEFANQAQQINPLSSLNRGTLAWWMMILGGLALVVFIFVKSGGVKESAGVVGAAITSRRKAKAKA